MFMYPYCYVYSVLYILFSIVPTGILRLPWPRFFCAFSSFVRQMPGYTSQRRGTVHTLPNSHCFVSIMCFYVLFVCVVLLLFVCKCVLYFCDRVLAQLRLTDYIISYIKFSEVAEKIGRPRRRWEGLLGSGWSWLRIGTGGGHLWVRWWTFGFQKCREFLD